MNTLVLLACTARSPGPVTPSTDTDDVRDTDTTVDTHRGGTGEPADAAFVVGLWVTRFSYANEAQVRTALAEAAQAGFTDVFFQVRGSFDAAYGSHHEPWMASLGALGVDPGWDPLAVAVDEAHARGLRLHAYINTFPMWKGSAAPASGGLPHAWNEHPDWRLALEDGSTPLSATDYVFADPAHPGVRDHVAAVARDIALHYPVDGIHLDYVRMPAGGPWETAVMDRTDAVTATVRGVADAVDVPVTAAVWGVYEDRWGWGGVSEGLHDHHQDSAAFLAAGASAIAPMMYFPPTDPEGGKLDFATLAADHVARVGGDHVWAGIEAKHGRDVAVASAAIARDKGAAGVVLFDWSQGREWLTDFVVATR